jgi:hypothetical protein
MRRKQVIGTILEDARNKEKIGERKQRTKHKKRQRKN